MSNLNEIKNALGQCALTSKERQILIDIVAGRRQLVFGDYDVAWAMRKLTDKELLLGELIKNEKLRQDAVHDLNREIDVDKAEIRYLESQIDDLECEIESNYTFIEQLNEMCF